MRQVRDSSRGTRRSTGVLVVLLVLALLLGAGGALCAAGVLQLPWPAEERASNPAEPAPESGAELPVSIAGPEGSEELATTVVSAPHPTSSEPPYDWDAELAPNYVLDCGPSQVRTASLPEGAYAQQATSLVFPLPTILYFDGFENVFSAVEKDLCPYGILPIENSAAGSVAPVYDAMVRHRFHIVKALRLRINHVLLVVPGTKMEDIKEISSHPHALAQCGEFLRAHPTWQQVPQTNTAVAAKALGKSRQKNRAVIASRACAELYGLDVLQENISNTAVNYTRFICISKNLEIYPDANKFSIMMSLPHRPGSLNTIISKFAAINVNLTKLESRPVPGMDFEFRFTFDFEASPRDPNVLALLAELAADPEIEHFTFLGAYAES